MSSTGEHEHDEAPKGSVARRAFLRGAVGAGGFALVSLLAACGGQGAATTGSGSTAAATGAATSAPSSSASSAAATTSASSSAASATASSAATSSAASTSVSTSGAATGSATKSASSRTDITKMPDNQTLRINLAGEPDKLDPNLAEFTNEIAVVRQAFDPLVLLDKDLKPVAGGAESWSASSDGLTWTFKIRSATYSDGTPVKAQDFEFSFKRILDPTVAAPYASYFAGVIKGSAAFNGALVAPPKASVAGDYVMGAMIAQAATTTSATGTSAASGSESTTASASGSTTASGSEIASTSSSGTLAASTTESGSATLSAASTSSGSSTAAGSTAAATTGSATTSAAASSAPNAKATVTPDQLKALRDAVGVKATDDSTLVITLEQPAGFLLDLVSLAVVPPLRQDIVSAGNWTTDVKNYIGNGPFAMIEHQPQDHILFAPNPNYWGGPPKIGLRYYMVTDNNADFAAYRNGERDINVPPQNDVPSIKSDPELSKEFKTNPTLLSIYMYYEMKHPPLDNQKFRYALSMAFDREAYVKDQLKGLGIPATYFIPQGMPGHIADAGSAYKFDAAKAKQMFQDSGVSVAAANKLSILFSDTPVNAQHYSYVQALWKKYLGIQIQLRPQEPKARVAAQKAHNFDLVVSGWSADYPDPQDWYDLFRTGDGNNNGEYSNPQFDALVKQADQEKDATKRLDLYAQADKILMTDQPALFMYQAIQFALIKPYVQNFTFTAQDEIPGDYFYKSITLASH